MESTTTVISGIGMLAEQSTKILSGMSVRQKRRSRSYHHSIKSKSVKQKQNLDVVRRLSKSHSTLNVMNLPKENKDVDIIRRP